MTGLLLVKLRRDLQASWPRFALMVIALAVSLVVFGGMLCGWSSIGRETSSGYMRTIPASATIVLDQGIDAERLAAIASAALTRPGVIAATARAQFASQAESDGSRAVPLQIFVAAPNDPMRMVKFDLGQEGHWPPAADEIFLRRDSLSMLGAAVGEVVTIRLPNGDRARLRVAGTVYDPSLAPSPQEQRGYGYLSTAALARPGQPVLLDQLKIQIADAGQMTATRDRSRAVAVAGEVGEWMGQQYGLTIREVQVPKPYAHPHQWQADVLLLSLLGGATAALLLSTILVANMLSNLFTQQIPQIGILKAIGARSVRIRRFYFAMTLLIAGAATVLALGPAIVLGQNGLQALLGMLGIVPVSLTPPWWAVAIILVVGLLLPPLMALPPLLKASRTTVRAAIDHRGLTAPASAATGVLARLSRIRGLNRGMLMAFRNIARRPARFWLAVGLLASAGAVFVAGMSLMSGTRAIGELQKAQRYWDVDVQLTAPAAEADVIRSVTDLPGVHRVEAWRREPVGIAELGRLPVTRTYPDQGHGSVAINTQSATSATPTILEGRWLNARETGSVVLNQATRDNAVPDLRAGDQVQLFINGKAATWRIAGIVEERGHGAGGVYATAEGLTAALGQGPLVNQIRIVTADHDEPARNKVAEAASKALTQTGFSVASAASISRSEEISAGHLGPVVLVLLGVALPLAVVGGIGLASVMTANILDRMREFGIMHAIGARPETVRWIVVAEGVFLAITSCLIAILPALVLTAILGAGLGSLFTNAPLPYRVSGIGAGIWIVFVILIAALATEAAANRASRITVREALNYL
jgi:putative ABC transport system permease protein